MKIAITSTDGKTVDQHFGKADSFYIYEKKDGKLNFIEKRNVVSYCGCVSVKQGDHEFDTDRFIRVFGTLQDCKKLYTTQIGDTPKAKLEANGIEIKLCSCEIDAIPVCSGNCKH